ncbi:(2Fe-2S)-binding protein [Geodermatophilus sp. URMC 63]
MGPGCRSGCLSTGVRRQTGARLRTGAGPGLMYVCLCTGMTSARVSQAVEDGAHTSKQVADACGAGSVCGRCRATIRAIIEASPRK